MGKGRRQGWSIVKVIVKVTETGMWGACRCVSRLGVNWYISMSRDEKQEMKGRDKRADTVNLEHYAKKPEFFSVSNEAGGMGQ